MNERTEELLAGLGLIIRDARDSRGVSQRELAEAVQCSESTIRRMELNPGVVHLQTVARTCGVLELPFFSVAIEHGTDTTDLYERG